jgi:hypothetical protein
VRESPDGIVTITEPEAAISACAKSASALEEIAMSSITTVRSRNACGLFVSSCVAVASIVA